MDVDNIHVMCVSSCDCVVGARGMLNVVGCEKYWELSSRHMRPKRGA